AGRREGRGGRPPGGWGGGPRLPPRPAPRAGARQVGKAPATVPHRFRKPRLPAASRPSPVTVPIQADRGTTTTTFLAGRLTLCSLAITPGFCSQTRQEDL